MEVYKYLDGILGALGARPDPGIPSNASWRIEQYLEAIYYAIKAGGGGGGGCSCNIMVANITETGDDITCDKSYDEIKAAIEAGTIVIGRRELDGSCGICYIPENNPSKIFLDVIRFGSNSWSDAHILGKTKFIIEKGGSSQRSTDDVITVEEGAYNQNILIDHIIGVLSWKAEDIDYAIGKGAIPVIRVANYNAGTGEREETYFYNVVSCCMGANEDEYAYYVKAIDATNDTLSIITYGASTMSDYPEVLSPIESVASDPR